MKTSSEKKYGKLKIEFRESKEMIDCCILYETYHFMQIYMNANKNVFLNRFLTKNS